MNCPKCRVELKTQLLQKIQVDRCPRCGGNWLDFEELDQLEDTVFDKDSLKGSIILRTHPGNLNCPKCGKVMKKFNYRLYDLEIDYCGDKHGFWLDKGEENRVIAIMKEEVQKTAREFSSEDEWVSMLRKLKSKSFVSRLFDLFRR